MKSIPFYFLLLLTLIACQQPDEQTRAINLECEYLENPIGVDAETPRLHWQMQDSRQGAHQTAYRIFVGTDSAKVANGKGEMWDSEKTSGDRMLVTYSGKALQPFTKYYWTVTIWNQDNRKSETSKVASLPASNCGLSRVNGPALSVASVNA
jgi:alpha-L-rhamnosidase